MTITVTPDTIAQALSAMRLGNPTKRFATDPGMKESLLVQQSDGNWAVLISTAVKGQRVVAMPGQHTIAFADEMFSQMGYIIHEPERDVQTVQ
jgi:hypothetical protein